MGSWELRDSICKADESVRERRSTLGEFVNGMFTGGDDGGASEMEGVFGTGEKRQGGAGLREKKEFACFVAFAFQLKNRGKLHAQ